MSDTVNQLLEAIDRALAMMKEHQEARFASDIDNLLRVRRVLEEMDPNEVEVLLEDADDDDDEDQKIASSGADDDDEDDDEDEDE
jgi:hypothetical protein